MAIVISNVKTRGVPGFLHLKQSLLKNQINVKPKKQKS